MEGVIDDQRGINGAVMEHGGGTRQRGHKDGVSRHASIILTLGNLHNDIVFKPQRRARAKIFP